MKPAPPVRALAVAGALFAVAAMALVAGGIAPPPSAKPFVGASIAAVIGLGELALLMRVGRGRRSRRWFIFGAVCFALLIVCAFFYRGAMVKLVYPCTNESAERCVGGTRLTDRFVKFCAAEGCASALAMLNDTSGDPTQVWVASSIPAAKQLLSSLFGLLLLLTASAGYGFARPFSGGARLLDDDALRIALQEAQERCVLRMGGLRAPRARFAEQLRRSGATSDPATRDAERAWRAVTVHYEVLRLLVRVIEVRKLAVAGGVAGDRAVLLHLANDIDSVLEAIGPAAAALVERQDAASLTALLAACGFSAADIDEQLARLRLIDRPPPNAEERGAGDESPAAPAPDPLLEEIFSLRTNRAELERLRAQVAGPGVLPFVGAGLSIPLGYPGWTAFLNRLAAEAGLTAEIDAAVASGEYEAAAQRLEDALTPFAFARRVENTYGAQHPVAGAVTTLPRLARGGVFTTNFDRVLEAVFAGAGQPFESTVSGARVAPVAAALFQGRRHLIKLHGDAADGDDRVLTAREYDRHYRADSPLPIVLTRMFSSTTILFVGCSLVYDRTMQKLAEAAAQAGPLPAHFALLESPATVEELRAREVELAQRRIVPIWYPHGKHESVSLLLNFLAAARAG